MNEEKLLENLNQIAKVAPRPESTNRVLATTEAAILKESERPAGTHWRASRVLAIVASFVAATVILWTIFASTGQVAYGQVLKNIEKAKTIQYLEERTNFTPGRVFEGPTEVTKVTVLGRHRQRRESVEIRKGDQLPDGQDWTGGPVGVVGISNHNTGEYVFLDTKQKTFSVPKRSFHISPDGKLGESKPAPAPEVDLYSRLRKFSTETAVRLPEKEIDGRKAVGFRVVEERKRNGWLATWERTVWVDGKTNLPVRMEIQFKSTNPMSGESSWVLSDMVFDQPIDESLLSTKPPAGFRVIE